MELPVVLQDNKSTISLVTKGGGIHRNKYLRVRQNGVKEKVDNGEIKVEYIPTWRMLADGLTKPLQGELGRAVARRLMQGPPEQTSCFGRQGCVEPYVRPPSRRTEPKGKK